MARKINHIYHFKRGTSEKWKETNLVLDEGEPGFEIDTGKLKIGNGKTRWNTLPYIADIDKVVLNTEIKEAIKNLKEEIINSTFTTIDITELPIENINNNCFYRITTGIFTKYTGPIYNFACFMVSSLTETGFPFTNESEENYWVYYNISDETLYGYIDNILSEIHEIPIGWHAFNNLIETFDIDYGGIITSAKDINEESKSIYFLIEQTLYKHNGVWTAGVSIGNTGEGHHAEKFNSDSNIAEGEFSHAEGYHTGAYGKRSHAEGSNTGADGNYSHAEGSQTLAEGVASHAEGSHSYASGRYAHAEGQHAEATGLVSHAEGHYSCAEGDNSHAEGNYTQAEGDNSHAEGNYTQAIGENAHAEGAHTTAEGEHSHVEGQSSCSIGVASHAEGYQANAKGHYSHAEGNITNAIGNASHAEGNSTSADGSFSHAEGYYSTAKGTSAHAEGNRTIANGLASHSEGEQSQSTGNAAHAEGYYAKAEGNYSHAEGQGTNTLSRSQHVQGEFNLIDKIEFPETETLPKDPDFLLNYNQPTPEGSPQDHPMTWSRSKYAHIVGNGTSDENRSNAHTLDWEGNAWFAGNVYIGGGGQEDPEAIRVLTTKDLDAINEILNTLIANQKN